MSLFALFVMSRLIVDLSPGLPVDPCPHPVHGDADCVRVAAGHPGFRLGSEGPGAAQAEAL